MSKYDKIKEKIQSIYLVAQTNIDNNYTDYIKEDKYDLYLCDNYIEAKNKLNNQLYLIPLTNIKVIKK